MVCTRRTRRNSDHRRPRRHHAGQLYREALGHSGGDKRAGRRDDHTAPELNEGEDRPLRNLQAGHIHIAGRHSQGLLRRQQHKEHPRALPARGQDRRQGQPHAGLHLRRKGTGSHSLRHRQGGRN